MKVWACYPTATLERGAGCAELWKSMGYRVAILCDPSVPEIKAADHTYYTTEYRGYWWAANKLADIAFRVNDADLVVYIGDDMDPDRNVDAVTIGQQFMERFPDGFGVMQPCGDKQGEMIDGKHAAARICGSPWFGRGWYERAFGGRRPVPDEFFHYYGDEILKECAERLGVLWMRPDLTQFHKHWAFGHGKQTEYQRRNSLGHWNSDKARFMAAKAGDFKTYLESFIHAPEVENTAL